jgi:phage baseplate assembly protein V
MMVSRAVVKIVDDSLKMQSVQIALLADELKDGVERFQQYGLTSHPKTGAEGIALFLGGNRDHGIVICVDDRRYRLKDLEAGEVALYDDLGQKVFLSRNGIFVETDREDGVRVIAPKVVVESDDISLGSEGGQKVARIGDLVNVGSGSSAGQWPIASGSDKVSAT